MALAMVLVAELLDISTMCDCRYWTSVDISGSMRKIDAGLV